MIDRKTKVSLPFGLVVVSIVVASLGFPSSARAQEELAATTQPTEVTATQPEDAPSTQPSTTTAPSDGASGENGDSPATQPATSQPTTDEALPPLTTQEVVTSAPVDIETIKEQIAHVEASSEYPDDLKKQWLGILQKTLEHMAMAATWREKRQDFKAKIESALDDLAKAKERLAERMARSASPVKIEVPPDATLRVLTQRQVEAEAAVAKTEERVSRLAEEAKYRATRRAAIPELLAAANERLETIRNDIDAIPTQGANPQIIQARRTLGNARKRAVEEEINSYREELRYYEASNEILSVYRQEAKLALQHAQASAEQWRQRVDKERLAEAQRQKEQARKELEAEIEVIRDLAQENTELAKEQTELAHKIPEVEAKAKKAKALDDQIQNDLKELRDKIDRPELSSLVGQVLREKRAELQELRFHEKERNLTNRELSRVLNRKSDIQDKQLRAADIDARVAEALKAAREEMPNVDKEAIEPRIRELLTTYRDQLDTLNGYYDTYSGDLVDLQADQAKLSASIEELRGFVESRILWMRSAPPIYQIKIPSNLTDLPRLAWAVCVSYWEILLSSIAIHVLVVLLLAALLVSRPRTKSRMLEAGEKVSRVSTDALHLTGTTLGSAILFAAPWPLLLGFVAWQLTKVKLVNPSATDVDDMAAALTLGLRETAMLWAMVTFAQIVCIPGGLADKHFRWDESLVKRARKYLLWFHLPAVLLVFVIMATEGYAIIDYRESIGRFAYFAFLVIVYVLFRQLLHPTQGMIVTIYRKNTDHWVYRLRYIWHIMLVGALLALMIASMIGYHYAAIELTNQLGVTVFLVMMVLLVYGLLARWVFYHQRKMAIAEARKKRAAMAAKEGASTGEGVAVEEQVLDVSNVSEQTLRLLRSSALLVLIGGLWIIWSELLPAMKFLNDIHLWGVDNVTLASLLVAIIVVVVTVIMAKNVPGLLEIAVLRHFQLDMGARFAASAITRYLITIIGFLIAFNLMGVGWSQVQWLAAAITVGLGFGLQEIFANFVSGLVLLFERPMRIGDTVTVGDVSGTVSKIRIRATTITGWDRKELVIPNKEFITGDFVNWTLSDSILRVIVPVGVAYGSDVDEALRILRRIANDQPTVVSDPEPRTLFVGFGDNSLNLELRVYIANIDDYLRTISDVHCAIDKAFREASIEIAFPQRDIHIRSIEAALPLQRHRSQDEAKPAQLQQAPPQEQGESSGTNEENEKDPRN